MRDTQLYISDGQVPRLLSVIEEEYETILFAAKALDRYRELSEEGKQQISLRGVRSCFPARSFFLPARERVAEYGAKAREGAVISVAGTQKPPALVNLRNCDVEAVTILDQIFLQGEFVDPFYQRRRESILVVSVDCASISEFCFCHMVGYRPFVEKGLGLNLSPVKEGFVARADSPAGERILERVKSFSSPVDEGRRQEVEQGHQATLTLLRESSEKFATARSYYDILKDARSSEKWNDLFDTCVECGACTNICPTCYCFYMFDRGRFPDREETFDRLRSWDSCLLADYSRMAGIGGVKPNPRPQIRARYANRFRHKYLYHHETYGRYGCTGCGRCSESCIGTTDPREVMRVLGQ
jgi:ferredoxin